MSRSFLFREVGLGRIRIDALILQTYIIAHSISVQIRTKFYLSLLVYYPQQCTFSQSLILLNPIYAPSLYHLFEFIVFTKLKMKFNPVNEMFCYADISSLENLYQYILFRLLLIIYFYVFIKKNLSSNFCNNYFWIKKDFN